MSGFESVRSISLAAKSGADIPQNRFVKASSTGVLLATAGSDSVGVSLEAYDDSEHAAGGAAGVIPVACLDGGKVMVEAGAAVAAGDPIASDGTGRAITATTSVQLLGYALEAAGAAGVIFQVVATKGGLTPAA